jgi:hypothetical protein
MLWYSYGVVARLDRIDAVEPARGRVQDGSAASAIRRFVI